MGLLGANAHSQADIAERMSRLERSRPLAGTAREDPGSAFRRIGIVAVAPTFADAIVGAVDPKLATRLLGKRFGGLDGFGLGAMNRRGTLVASSDTRPSAVSTMGHMIVLFGHRSLLSTLGVTPQSGIT